MITCLLAPLQTPCTNVNPYKCITKCIALLFKERLIEPEELCGDPPLGYRAVSISGIIDNGPFRYGVITLGGRGD